MTIAEALSLRTDARRRVDQLRARITADGTMTDALARRDVRRLRHALLTSAADAAAGTGFRQLRSELRQLTSLPVRELRSRADDVARALRELDVRVQQAHWTHDLAE